MLGKPTQGQKQLSLFGSNLIQLINLNQPLVRLTDIIPWQQIENQFKHLYAKVGCPSHPIRKMAGLLLLQYIYKLSDEKVVAVWEQNVYFQYFSGEACFQWSQPCAASDLVHFRKRIGEAGVNYLFTLSVSLHQEKVNKAQEVIVDTTVQEKNITFPTDAKLYKKVIERVNREAQKLGVKLRQSYVRVVKKLLYLQRYAALPKQGRKAKKALAKLRTIAGRQVRDLTRQVSMLGKQKVYTPLLERMQAILSQTKHSRDKIYSLHEKAVSCIAKGKAGKKYEFGSKVSLASLPGSGIIVGVKTYQGNPHDSTTLASTMEQVKAVTGKTFKRVLLDKGYRGAKLGQSSELVLPGKKGMNKQSYAYVKYKGCCRRRPAIEARIRHLKYSHKLERNYLKGSVGDVVNALLAGIGYNLHLLLLEISRETNKQASFLFLFIYLMVVGIKWMAARRANIGSYRIATILG